MFLLIFEPFWGDRILTISRRQPVAEINVTAFPTWEECNVVCDDLGSKNGLWVHPRAPLLLCPEHCLEGSLAAIRDSCGTCSLPVDVLTRALVNWTELTSSLRRQLTNNANLLTHLLFFAGTT